MIGLERTLADLRAAKVPLISYGAEGQLNIGNSENDSKNKPLPSVLELMNILGYNIHRKSWQKTFLSIKPAHWAKVTILPWEKVLNVLKVAGFFRKGISAAIRRKAIRSAQLNLRKKWTVAPLALRFGR